MGNKLSVYVFAFTLLDSYVNKIQSYITDNDNDIIIAKNTVYKLSNYVAYVTSDFSDSRAQNRHYYPLG